jgi:NAD-dependent deacetylase
MTTNQRGATAQLSLIQLLRALKCKKVVAVIGYALSEEAGIPQFEAILNGVWSGAPKNINPFNDGYGREVVLGWFGWRMQLICKKSHEPFFQAVCDIKAALNLTLVATQTVDGQLRFSGLHDAQELYGNVFDGRCSRCGIVAPSLLPKMMHASMHPICESCGGNIFPDVTMFGWNQKTKTQDQIKTICAEADTIILIGADLSLAPFNGRNSLGTYPNKVLEVLPKELVLSERSTVLRATPKELSDELDKQHGKNVPLPNFSSLKSNLEYLTRLVRAVEGLGASRD